jgi:amino acid transporter
MSINEDKKDVVYDTHVAPAHQANHITYDDEPAEVHSGLKRQLKSRHMAMISIGGVIGTGES